MEVDFLQEDLSQDTINTFYKKLRIYYERELERAKEVGLTYTNETFVLDVIYFLGLSINKDYDFRSGFIKFQRELIRIFLKCGRNIKDRETLNEELEDFFKLFEEKFLEEWEVIL